jgi:hypothetical protein
MRLLVSYAVAVQCMKAGLALVSIGRWAWWEGDSLADTRTRGWITGLLFREPQQAKGGFFCWVSILHFIQVYVLG